MTACGELCQYAYFVEKVRVLNGYNFSLYFSQKIQL